ncbi:amino acid adenylation domain-containing protein [Bacillus sp. FJAT-26377]|nr:amino acid adenylation domain-containing protein [Bacillus sp. FJAT-26377]
MKEVILVFARRDDIFKELANKEFDNKQENRIFILVKPGDIYRQLGNFIYQINPRNSNDYQKLLTILKETFTHINHIVHLWDYESRDLDYNYHGDIKRFIKSHDDSLISGINSIRNLTESMVLLDYSNQTSIHYFHYGMKENIQPKNLMVQNSYLYFPEQQSKYQFHSINMSENYKNKKEIAKILLERLSFPQHKNEINSKYDGGENEILSLNPYINVPPELLINSNGTYIFVDNDKNMGLTLGLEMVEQFGCNVVVIGSGELSTNTNEIINNINSKGLKFTYKKANLSSYSEIQQAIQHIKGQFQYMKGVICCLDDKVNNSYTDNINKILIIDDFTAEIPLDFYLIVGIIAEPPNSIHKEKVLKTPDFSDGFVALRNYQVQKRNRFGLSYTVKWSHNSLTGANSLLSLLSESVNVQASFSELKKSGKIDLNNVEVKEAILNLMRKGISKLIAETLKINENEVSLDFSINLDSPDGLHFDSISLSVLAEKIRSKYKVKLTPVVFFQHKSLKNLIDFLFEKYSDNFVQYYRLYLDEGTLERSTNIPPASLKTDKTKKYKETIKSQKNIDKASTQGTWEWLDHDDNSTLPIRDDEDAIAIIGASGKFPGANNLNELWDNLEGEKNLITEIPADRWHWEDYYGDPHQEKNKTNIKWGGFLDGIDQFDPAFFNISEKEAKIMDPRQRILLETTWETIEDAGYKMSDFSGSKTAVVIGAGSSEYYELLTKYNVNIEEQSSTSKSNSILANRISYLFNFIGPSESIDVACASSVVAIHRAAEYIKNGECDTAIAGGIHIMLTPDMHIAFNKGGVLSEEGKSRVFDKNANGYVRSEGVGTVLLKPLKKALADKDHVYAVIRGSAVNHNGRSNSMTSPSPTAQEEVLVKSYQKGKVNPSSVNYIEVHGSATGMGDAVEVMALNNAFSTLDSIYSNPSKQSYCGIGSLKNNIGHTEEAAGMAALFKVLMAIKNQKIPATINFNSLNPNIDLSSSPFYIVNEVKNWNKVQNQEGSPLSRTAGISTFGFGGVNAHLIVEEVESQKKFFNMKPNLIILSAENEDVLRKYAERIRSYLDSKYSENDSMTDIAFTLQLGREEMPSRLAIVACSKEELKEKLDQYLENNSKVDGIHFGFSEHKKFKKENKTIEQVKLKGLLENGEIEEIAELWVKGKMIDWSFIHKDYSPNRVSLPTYPFNKRRFWFSAPDRGNNFKEKKQSLLKGNEIIDGYEQVLFEWNQTERNYYKDSFVCELIEKQAIEKPNKLAVIFEEKSLTYRQLVEEVDKLACYLKEKEVTEGSYVGLFVNRSLEMLISILAVLKAGGIYVPLDPVFPEERIRLIIKDTNLNFIITESENIGALPQFNGNLIVLDQEKEQIKSSIPRNLKLDGKTDDQVAYVIYTSGSTGTPKGVQVTHKNLMNLLSSMAVEPGMDENDYLLAVTTLCFDIAGLELLLPLTQGAKVEILSDAVAKDGIKLKEKIENSNATIMQATPSRWNILLSAGWDGKKGFKILSGGELLSEELAERLLGCGEEVWNLYGPTETTIWSTISKVRKGKKVNVGRPIANTQTYILNENLKPVPVGTIGELYIGGDGVSKGYLNKSDLNQQKFISNPYLDEKLIYQTGDLAFYNESGEINIVGRVDNQIKLNGYRMEIEEIEKKLCAIPHIEQAAVVVRKDNTEHEKLVAFYTLKKKSVTLTNQDIVSELRKELPNYMIPTSITLLNTLPLTLNVKLDRKTLAEKDLKLILESYGVPESDSSKTNRQILLNNQSSVHNHKNTVEQADLLLRSLEGDLQRIAAKILNCAAEELETNRSLGEYGFSSVLFTSLAIEINKKYRSEISAVIFFKYTTITSIAVYLLENNTEAIQQAYYSIINKNKQTTQPVENSKEPSEIKEEPIAIIGIFGRMPQSKDLNSFWGNLIDNKNMIMEIPRKRWDYERYFGNPQKDENKSNSKWGGFISDEDCFDASFFGISPREAEYMDPRQRLMIESVWKTFEDGGYKPEDFSDTKTGLFIGAINSDYWDMMREYNVPADGYTLSGFANSILANRVSYMFNLKGPSEVVDTACSSSLTAIDKAVKSLRNGDCNLAIAGGVNLLLSPYLYLALSKNGMLSPDGKCKTFDKLANGYVRGEGVGTILLKPLSKAIKDNDNIYAVIKSTAVNHGGKSNSLTAPNPKAQTELLVDAYAKAEIDPSTITYIETHGTGTKLGDPIEVEALKEAFDMLYKMSGKDKPSKPYCGLGAVKTNIGHLEAAAGIASVLKVILSIKAGQIPANINFEKINSFIDLEDSYFYLINKNKKWDRLLDNKGFELPRRAGISSFGFGGANAHVVIEEYIEETESDVDKEPNLIVLSAQNKERLLEYARNLLDFINGLESQEQKENNVTLSRIAYTLQVGRNAMEERLAVVVDNIKELREKLTSYVNQEGTSDVYTGNKIENKKIIENLFIGDTGNQYLEILTKQRELRTLAKMWINGVEIDWGKMYKKSPKKLNVPTYPFAKERYWFTNKEEYTSKSTLSPLTPLVDSNESNIEETCYKKKWSSKDLFLRDHIIRGNNVLPAVVYLEMARMVGKIANNNRNVKKLKNIVWIRPFEVHDFPRDIYLNIERKENKVEFIINSRSEKVDERIIHAQGRIEYQSNSLESIKEYIDIEEIKQSCLNLRRHDEFYEQLNLLGYNYGPSFKPISHLYYNEKEALAKINLPIDLEEEFDNFLLHPSIMEGVLQTLAGLLFEKESQSNIPFVPFSLNELEIMNPFGKVCYSYITISNDEALQATHNLRYNILLLDENGLVLAKLKDYSVRPIEKNENTIEVNHNFKNTSPICYDVQLTNLEIENQAKGLNGPLLIFDYDESLLNSIQFKELEGVRGNIPVVLVKPGNSFGKITYNTYEINPSDYNDYCKLLKSLDETNLFPKEIIHKWCKEKFSYDQKVLNLQLDIGVYSLFHLCKAIVNQKKYKDINLLTLYQSEERSSQPLFEALKGLAKSVKAEYPQINLKVIEHVSKNSILNLPEFVGNILSEFYSDNYYDDFVIYQSGKRFVERFKQVYLNQSSSNTSITKENGVYLITGGAGGIGRLLAEHLAKSKGIKIVLTGRSELSLQTERILNNLKNRGCEALYLKADITKYDEVKLLAGKIKDRFGKLNGIIHCAGEIRDAVLLNKNIEDFKAVLSAKVIGTIYLDDVFQNEELDYFALFSSISSIFGNIGQTDYAFANSFLNVFSLYRESLRNQKLRFGKTLAMNWPLWREGGMKVDNEVQKFLLNYFGIIPIEKDTGLNALELCLDSPYNQVVVLEENSEKIKRHLGGFSRHEELNKSTLSHKSLEEHKDWSSEVKKELLRQVSDILKIELEKIDINKNMSTYGFDSISFTELANKINDVYQVDLTPAVFFELESPTILALTKLLNKRYSTQIQIFYRINKPDYQVKQINPTKSANDISRYNFVDEGNNSKQNNRNKILMSDSENNEAPQTSREQVQDEPIAVIGIDGVMPQSENLDHFWYNLENGKDLITEIPKNRFDWQSYFGDPMHESNKTNSKWGGFMKEVDKFDALFFGITPKEAELMDPQHRIFMEVVWRAIENAGYKASDLSGTRTGVYVGITNRDYADVINQNSEKIEPQGIFGNTHPFLPNRISFLLNLHGPSMAIDTLCSSSLISIHRAVEDLKQGHCELAIAGGVNIINSPTMNIAFSKANMLSEDGRCKTFDKDANGFVRGEGAGAVILKPLSKAKRDGDYIYGVIKGTAENHGGHSNSLTAPNVNAQADVIMRAYENAGISPEKVSYIEAHGTGTKIGDPIEINGLKKAFQDMFEKKGIIKPDTSYCGIGSVKTNIGHLEAAAGIAGFLKVILALKHKKLPGNLHLNEINSYIDLKMSPFYINSETCEWEPLVDRHGRKIPRIAGISSFGAGGVNAHIILEENQEYFNKPESTNNKAQVIILSGKSKSSLKNYALMLSDYLEDYDIEDFDTKINLENIAYTLQVGREEMEERVALVVSSIEELKEKLKSLIKSNTKLPYVYKGSLYNHSSQVDFENKLSLKNRLNSQNVDIETLSLLAEVWVQGENIDWNILYEKTKPFRIPLPTYPFAREKHWVENEKHGDKHQNIHPMIHQNRSVVKGASFTSRFIGREFFFTDHVVGGKKILPGVSYIEMAKVGGELAGEKRISEIKNLIWPKSMVIEDIPKEIDLKFYETQDGIEFSVTASDTKDEAPYAQGELIYSDELKDSNQSFEIELSSIKEKCFEVRNKYQIYNDFVTKGFNYGPSFQTIEKLYANHHECLSLINLPVERKIDFSRFNLHPSLLDGALQTAVELLGLSETISNESHMPFSVANINFVNPIIEDECYAYATLVGSSSSDQSIKKFNIMLLDKNGRLLVNFKDFTVRVIKAAKYDKELKYYRDEWIQEENKLNINSQFKSNILIFDQNIDKYASLKSNMSPESRIVLVREGTGYKKINDNLFEVNPSQREHYQRLIEELMLNNFVPEKIIHAWSLNTTSKEELLKYSISISFYSLFNLTQAMLKSGIKQKICLLYLYSSNEEKRKPEYSAISAFARTVQIEQPAFSYKTMNIDNLSMDQIFNGESNIIEQALMSESVNDSDVRYKNGKRYVKKYREVNI